MRVLLFDIDTLRPDHLGCYGYGRSTSPCIDSVAAQGVRFEDYYCPNAPCLPARASLITGLYGIHSGILGHGGTAADLRLSGQSRSFTDSLSENGLFMEFRRAGFHTVSFSTFAERHSAWWFGAGLNESVNVGARGGETADRVTDEVLGWLGRNKEQDNWMLHVHFWDPHTPYRTPDSFINPFVNEPLPDDWITPEVFAGHLSHIGPHGAMELNMWDDERLAAWPHHPGSLSSSEEAKSFIDLYDGGVRFADDNIGRILGFLREQGLYDEELAIIITSDHGEDLGELGLYGEHALADYPVCRIPMIIKWPGACRGEVARGFHDNTDLLPTVRQLLGGEERCDCRCDGVSFADTLLSGTSCAREYVVLNQCAHVCQRAVRFEDYLYLRTIHGGYHLFPREMLFNLADDPHEQHDLAPENPALCARGARLLLDWTEDMMKTSSSDADPLWTVLREGGPEHCRGQLPGYLLRLRATGREQGAALLREHYPQG